MWNEFKVTNSFTLETSMFGKRKNNSKFKPQKIKHGQVKQLEIEDFKSIAKNLLKSFC